MQAKDVMTTPVVTIAPDTTVPDIAKTMLAKSISAVPVVADGKLVGIVSEGDLMRRVETGTERHAWWLTYLVDEPEERAKTYVKSHGKLARDVMTPKVLTVTPTTPLEDIAPLLDKHRIKRVPVVDANGALVGIVSRANLLHGLTVRKTPKPVSADDENLREALIDAINDTGIDYHLVTMVVADGEAHLWGSVQTENEKRALEVAVENTPGLKSIDNRVGLLPRGLLATA